jgi:hypothetical protein
MKLRIRGDSLRLRLSQAEVKRLQQGEPIMERVRFHPQSSLTYGLKTHDEVQAMAAHFEGDQVWVTVPAKMAFAWASSDKVEIFSEQDNGAEKKLTILIEKDFTCLKPRRNEREDESDLFPNPNEAHGSCS